MNHVALVYPIEIDLARAIAGGNAVTDVTWPVVAELSTAVSVHTPVVTTLVFASVVELLDANPDLVVLAVSFPIGLPAVGPRAAAAFPYRSRIRRAA